jgi:hypothetical protein
MTATIPQYSTSSAGDDWHEYAPDNISPLVVWLGSERSRKVTGRVFSVAGGAIEIADGWDRGPRIDEHARWEVDELDDVIASLLADAKPIPPLRVQY